MDVPQVGERFVAHAPHPPNAGARSLIDQTASTRQDRRGDAGDRSGDAGQTESVVILGERLFLIVVHGSSLGRDTQAVTSHCDIRSRDKEARKEMRDE